MKSKMDKIFNYLVIWPLYICWRVIWRVVKIDRIAIIFFGIMSISTLFFYPITYIPSPSMMPTLLNRDFVLLSKIDYGYNEYSFPLSQYWPKILNHVGQIKRGDIVTFSPPSKSIHSYDVIKRVIGMPGDNIKMHRGNLFINNQKVKIKVIKSNVVFDERDIGYESNMKFVTGTILEEELPNGIKHKIFKHLNIDENAYDFPDQPLEIIVPQDHYFVLGDNRDSSSDSRSGYLFDTPLSFQCVPRNRIIAKAKAIIFSTRGMWYEPWSYFSQSRLKRLSCL